MAKEKRTARVKSQERLIDGVFSMWIQAGEMAEEARAGQFISVYPKDGANLLPRPVSICELNRQAGEIRIVYRVVGRGTREFSGYRAGDGIDVMGPLGNGFERFPGDRRALLIGGGIGIPPMLELAKSLSCDKQVILGYKDQMFMAEEFAPYGKVFIAVEETGAGFPAAGGDVPAAKGGFPAAGGDVPAAKGGFPATKGNVLDAVRQQGLSADVIAACGPIPMLRAVKEYALEHGMECYLSLEEKMACGVGACLACVCRTADADPHSNVRNARICKDGPVFEARKVEL